MSYERHVDQLCQLQVSSCSGPKQEVLSISEFSQAILSTNCAYRNNVPETTFQKRKKTALLEKMLSGSTLDFQSGLFQANTMASSFMRRNKISCHYILHWFDLFYMDFIQVLSLWSPTNGIVTYKDYFKQYLKEKRRTWPFHTYEVPDSRKGMRTPSTTTIFFTLGFAKVFFDLVWTALR